MDPVSLAVACDTAAELPALPDLGSVAEPSGSPTAKTTTAASASDAGSGSRTGLYLGIGGAGVLAAAAGALYVTRRRAGTRQNTD